MSLDKKSSTVEENNRDSEEILNEIEYIFDNISQKSCLINKNQRCKKIVKSIQCFVNFKYYLLEAESYEPKYLKEFKKLIHKCISLCLVLKKKESFFKEKAELEDLHQYYFLMVKLFMYLIMTTMNEDSWNYSLKKNEIYF